MLPKFFERKSSAKKSEWQPIKHTFIHDKLLIDKINDVGFVTAGSLDDGTLQKLNELYHGLHSFKQANGGMFYSVYSQDIDYRKKVHHSINEILEPVYDRLFYNYKSVLNSFIVKINGPESEFSLHQDSTGLDETKYSCLSVWIPLQDVNTSNGCMCLVPYSHKMFSPYRGISFTPPFESISNTIRRYLQPIELKAGEIFLFDNRLIHNSVINSSGTDRVVVMSGIFPNEAKIISCYKDSNSPDDRIEIIEQDDDFLITFDKFFHDCTCRPETGHSKGFVNWDATQMSESTFLSLCNKFKLNPIDHPAALYPTLHQTIVGEPI